MTRIPAPDQLGAIIAKSAAYKLDTKQSRTRHLTDAAVLLACVEGDLPTGMADLTKNDRVRLRYLAERIEPSEPAWDLLDSEQAARGQAVLRRIEALLAS
ncbi:MAG: hypothetical protein HIU86_13715 [Acidobacteria bacterium]|nr:hypothetical protein [Acidobacteriota bacterium]